MLDADLRVDVEDERAVREAAVAAEQPRGAVCLRVTGADQPADEVAGLRAVGDRNRGVRAELLDGGPEDLRGGVGATPEQEHERDQYDRRAEAAEPAHRCRLRGWCLPQRLRPTMHR